MSLVRVCYPNAFRFEIGMRTNLGFRKSSMTTSLPIRERLWNIPSERGLGESLRSRAIRA